MNVNII